MGVLAETVAPAADAASLEFGATTWFGIVATVFVTTLGSRVIATWIEQRATAAAEARGRNQEHGRRLLKRLRDLRNQAQVMNLSPGRQAPDPKDVAQLRMLLNDAEISASSTGEEVVASAFATYRDTVANWAVKDEDVSSEDEAKHFDALLIQTRAFMRKKS